MKKLKLIVKREVIRNLDRRLQGPKLMQVAGGLIGSGNGSCTSGDYPHCWPDPPVQ